MSAAEETAAHFNAVTDDSTFAMSTNRRNGVNGALKAVKRMPRSSRDQFKGLVIFIAANFAC